MNRSKLQLALGLPLAYAALTFSLAVCAQAQTLTTVYNFGSGHDGANPGGLVGDADGKFYGMASGGSSAGRGIIFQLSPPAEAADKWTGTILYNFQGVPMELVYGTFFGLAQ